MGWPHGFTARRDAFLVVLVGLMGFSRAQACTITPTDIGLVEATRPGSLCPSPSWMIRGRLVPHGHNLPDCGQCQVTLWLGVWSAWINRFRTGVADWLAARGNYWGHVCDDADAEAGTAWRTEKVILTGIDRHNWPSTQTLSARQISRIIAKHQQSGPDVMVPREQQRTREPTSASFGRRVDIDPDGSLSEALERLEAATDAAMERLKDLMSKI